MDFTETPLVSIILPLYRVWAFLPQTIASVKAQTYPHFECLCLDDGSGNEMLDTLRALTEDDARFKVYAFPNAGVAVTRNRGLALATGEWIAFLDQDDCFHPCFLEWSLARAYRTQADCVACHVQVIDHDTDYVAMPFDRTPSGRETLLDDPLRWLLTAKDAVWFVWCMLWRRSALGATRFAPDLRGSDDALFVFAHYADFRRVAVSEDRLIFYRRHPQSVTVLNPPSFMLARLAFLARLRTIVPKRLHAELHAYLLKELASFLKQTMRAHYAGPDRRSIRAAMLALVRENALPLHHWSFGKRLRWFRFRLLCQ